MQVQGANHGEQMVAQTAQAMKSILQTAVNASQDINGKLIGMAAEQKVSGQETSNKVNLLA